jgi:DNA phosphorothioation-dependent restriction protein DptG
MRAVQITFITTLFVLFSTVSVYSQGRNKRSPEDIAKQQTEWMKQELKLSKEQEQKIYRINLETSKKIRETWEKHQGDREAMQEAMKVTRRQKDKEMKEALTKEQYELYKKKLEERRRNFQNRKKGMM